MEKHLHIITLDVPWPADYGGVYDLFYKLPVLHALGVKIHLHCFENGRGEQSELNRFCEKVYYYKRQTGYKAFSTLPYIVTSRESEQLAANLLKDDHPILMEGVHCTYPAIEERFAKRRKFIRVHNVEHYYYKQLFSCSHHPLKKMYYWRESILLKKYEQQLVNKARAFWTVSKQDTAYYREKLGCSTADYLPLFLPPWNVCGKEGMGNYCLYHGKLSVDENEYAAAWLLQHVFAELDIPFVIAGKNATGLLKRLAHKRKHTCVVDNPSEDVLQDIITKAHIHILPSFNNTGIKIKLLNALYNGRHCLVNSAMVDGTGLSDLCHVADDANAFRERLQMLYHQPFSQADIETRKLVLNSHFNNEACAKQIVKWIWETYA